MKKNTLYLAIVALATCSLVFTGCSDDDTTAPVVTLLGSDPLTISLNVTSVADPGATAEDDEDGALTVSSNWSATNPNVNQTGTYTITYTAQDAAGNVGEATRTVIIKNDADYLAGTYLTSETGSTPWTQTITASETINNRKIGRAH